MEIIDTYSSLNIQGLSFINPFFIFNYMHARMY